MIPVAREGWIFILPPFGLAVMLWAVGWQAAALAALVLAGAVALFFRDPPREIPRGEGLILAPADGTVVQVTPYSGDELGGNATQLSIFLSVLDVHVNRAPFPAVVERVDYRAGGFRLAWHNEASVADRKSVV